MRIFKDSDKVHFTTYFLSMFPKLSTEKEYTVEVSYDSDEYPYLLIVYDEQTDQVMTFTSNGYYNTSHKKPSLIHADDVIKVNDIVKINSDYFDKVEYDVNTNYIKDKSYLVSDYGNGRLAIYFNSDERLIFNNDGTIDSDVKAVTKVDTLKYKVGDDIKFTDVFIEDYDPIFSENKMTIISINSTQQCPIKAKSVKDPLTYNFDLNGCSPLRKNIIAIEPFIPSCDFNVGDTAITISNSNNRFVDIIDINYNDRTITDSENIVYDLEGKIDNVVYLFKNTPNNYDSITYLYGKINHKLPNNKDILHKLIDNKHKYIVGYFSKIDYNEALDKRKLGVFESKIFYTKDAPFIVPINPITGEILTHDDLSKLYGISDD